MPPKKSSSTKNGAPINQCMLQTKMSHRTDAESDTQDHPKTDDPVTDDEDNGEGQVDAHKGNLVDDPKICESLPPSDTPEDEDSSLENNYLYQNQEARRWAECHAMLAQHDPSSSEEESDEDDEYKEDQDADEEKEEEDNDNDNEIPAPPSKAKLPKKHAPPKALPPKFTVTETPPSTQVLQAAVHVMMKSVKKSAISSALPKSSMAMETDDDNNDLPITSRPGWLCREGIDDVQELGHKTLHTAKIIGDKYGKSAHTILIEARLSVKHSRAETPWNMHQGWYKGKYPRETDEELGDWRKRQHDHYYSLQDSDLLIVMSTRDALTKCIGLLLQQIMVLEKLEQFGYKMKSVQWQKLLNVAYQNKFQFKLWPDEVPPVGPDFNYHTLSTQHLKLLVMPYIKCKASQHYDTELKTEAENLLKLQRKQGCSDKTLDDIIDKLDIAVSEIDIVPWLKDHIKQCEKDNPKMFDIPLKLRDSKKFKHSIHKGLLQKYKEATSICGLNVSAPLGGRQLEDTTQDHWSQQQTSTACEYSIVCEKHYTDDGLPIPECCPLVFQQQKSHKQPHAEDYGKSMNYLQVLIKCLADQQLESEVDSLNASNSCITKKSKLIFRFHMLNCHLCTLSLLILDLDFNLNLALVHLHLTMNYLNTGMMRPFESGCKGILNDYVFCGPKLWCTMGTQKIMSALKSFHMFAGSSQGSIDVGQPSVYVICGGPAQGLYWAVPYIYCPLNIEQVRQQEQKGLVIWSMEAPYWWVEAQWHLTYW
ncbi:uncharacterized protein BJ212DRAFT_1304576 [Suillus subaureus]|uniref:Uncharacterized protein n=1 Tax=Suillus subaureus TaxID=48587 RepID=A0A9P7DUN3_9AGAM|nr:uncharacterized protein BJ212DRAFT_1304576 [Suillus subaureus]KAG1803426.1 hypothetical protein BJ212DRAFT_1304576 [Suillus subaureus]